MCFQGWGLSKEGFGEWGIGPVVIGLNVGDSETSNVVPIIWATFWVISESLILGSTHGNPGSWHPFFDVISESVLLISTLWLNIQLLAYSFMSSNDSSYYILKLINW